MIHVTDQERIDFYTAANQNFRPALQLIGYNHDLDHVYWETSERLRNIREKKEKARNARRAKNARKKLLQPNK